MTSAGGPWPRRPTCSIMAPRVPPSAGRRLVGWDRVEHLLGDALAELLAGLVVYAGVLARPDPAQTGLVRRGGQAGEGAGDTRIGRGRDGEGLVRPEERGQDGGG